MLLDIQAVQSRAHGERGISRYVLNLASALQQEHPRLVAAYLLNPDLPWPGSIEPVLGRGQVTFSDRVAGCAGRVHHIGSAIEDVPLERLAPRFTRGMRTVVTLYDLIPRLFPEIYLSDPRTRALYARRLALVRGADRVLAISEATARDAVEQLGVAPERVIVVGAGVSEEFTRPESRADLLAELRRQLPWLEPGFVLYTGGIEPRKNIDRLLVAYAGLPAKLRDEHQLVIVCRVDPSQLDPLSRRLGELGVAGRVRFPGYVADDRLVRLYQACELFVFPSLYEGFGLPVAEAIACGAPAIASNTSSLPELVRDPEALFDPSEPQAIRTALERALTDERLRARLRDVRLDERHTWRAVAARTAAVYEELADSPPKPRRRKHRIGFVSPLPPARSGIAEVSHQLLEQLVTRWEIDAFADQAAAVTPDGILFKHIRRFDIANAARGCYDRVVVCLGNSEHHAEALALLRRQPAVVIAHDVRLTGLYAWTAANRPDLEPRGFQGALHSMYRNRLPRELGAAGGLDVTEYEGYGILMAREAIALAERFLVHSEYAAELARLEAAPGDARKIGVLPFGIPPPPPEDPAPRNDRPLLATFGIAGPSKQPDKVLQAFAELLGEEPDAELAFAGPMAPPEEARLRQVAAGLGIEGRLRMTGELSEEEFRGWMSRAWVALQLRAASNGETSAAVTECLSAGVPTVVTAIGSAKELPDDAVVKVDRDIAPSALARELASLLRDPTRQAALREAGRRYASENTFARAADALYDEVMQPSSLPR